MTEQRMEEEQSHKSPSPLRLAEIDAQQKIMARVDELMTEAAQTRRSAVQDIGARPFWAQTRVDIPPSEQFGKLNQMTEEDSPKKLENQEPPVPVSGSQTSENTQTSALSAIRDEVINKMAAPATKNMPDFEDWQQRLAALEGRVDKHQQDLTALLKLVRQLAAKQDEKPAPQKVKAAKSSSGWGFGLLMMLLLVAGITGWLFWMDSAFMMELLTTFVNESLTMIIQLLAELGAV